MKKSLIFLLVIFLSFFCLNPIYATEDLEPSNTTIIELDGINSNQFGERKTEIQLENGNVAEIGVVPYVDPNIPSTRAPIVYKNQSGEVNPGTYTWTIYYKESAKNDSAYLHVSFNVKFTTSVSSYAKINSVSGYTNLKNCVSVAQPQISVATASETKKALALADAKCYAGVVDAAYRDIKLRFYVDKNDIYTIYVTVEKF